MWSKFGLGVNERAGARRQPFRDGGRGRSRNRAGRHTHRRIQYWGAPTFTETQTLTEDLVRDKLLRRLNVEAARRAEWGPKEDPYRYIARAAGLRVSARRGQASRASAERREPPHA